MSLSLFSGRAMREWALPRSRIDQASLAILAALLITFAIQGLFESDGRFEEVQDHIITQSLSRQVVDYGLFFRDFVYPLPAIIFKVLLGDLGDTVSSVLWSILSVFCGLWLACALVVLTRNESSPRAFLAPLLAVISLTWCVQWDYDAVNANMVFLALVAGSGVGSLRGRPGWAGLLLASSIALKLYSAPLLLYWLLVGRLREVAWTSLWCVFYFAMVPALYFGPDQALHLTGLWLDRVLATGSPEFVIELIGYKVSLQSVWFAWTGPEGVASTTSLMGLRSIQFGFLALVLIFCLLPKRMRAAEEGERWVTDAGLILMAMLIISPMVQPHQGVLLLLPASLLAFRAVDLGESARVRGFAAGALALIFVLFKVAPSGIGKGVALNLSIAILAAAVVAFERVSRRKQREPD